MISLSLCMIVKNEEAVLERILKPVSQVMDAILIADTGSSDRTKEIAEQYTSQVFDFPWCDDFSAPRNFLLEKVRTDYWMWLDADDVLDEENLEKLKSLKETLDPGTDVVMKIRPDGCKIRSMPVLYLDSVTGKWEKKSTHWKLFCTA